MMQWHNFLEKLCLFANIRKCGHIVLHIRRQCDFDKMEHLLILSRRYKICQIWKIHQ